MKTIINGTTYHYDGKYYEGINQHVAHGIKDRDIELMRYAAARMAKLIKGNAVLIPIPNRNGRAYTTEMLCVMIAKEIHARGGASCLVSDILKSKQHESQYTAKLNGRALTEDELGIKSCCPDLCEHFDSEDGEWTFYLVDNVADTGTTARAALRAMPYCEVLTFAATDNLLAQADPTTYNAPIL